MTWHIHTLPLTWLIHIMTYSYTWSNTFIHWQWHGSFARCLIPIYGVTHSYIGSDMAHSYRASFLYMTWHIHTSALTLLIRVMTHSYTWSNKFMHGQWHGSFVRWLIPIYDVTHSYIGSDMALSWDDSCIRVLLETYRNVWDYSSVSYLWRDTFTHCHCHGSFVSWLIPIYDMTHSYIGSDMAHIFERMNEARYIGRNMALGSRTHW